MEMLEGILKMFVSALLIYFIYKHNKLKRKYYHEINKNIHDNEIQNSKIKNFLERNNLWVLSNFTLEQSINQLMEFIKTKKKLQKDIESEFEEKCREIKKLNNTISEKDKYIKRQMGHINTLYTRIAYREKIIERNGYKMRTKKSKKYG